MPQEGCRFKIRFGGATKLGTPQPFFSDLRGTIYAADKLHVSFSFFLHAWVRGARPVSSECGSGHGERRFGWLADSPLLLENSRCWIA